MAPKTDDYRTAPKGIKKARPEVGLYRRLEATIGFEPMNEAFAELEYMVSGCFNLITSIALTI